LGGQKATDNDKRRPEKDVQPRAVGLEKINKVDKIEQRKETMYNATGVYPFPSIPFCSGQKSHSEHNLSSVQSDCPVVCPRQAREMDYYSYLAA